MFTARRRRFNQRPSAMHATLQGISLRHTNILLRLRLPHHSDFRERFRTKRFDSACNGTATPLGMGAGQDVCQGLFRAVPKDRYQTEVASWRPLQSANIEFVMKRLREPGKIAHSANERGGL
jgi:hypothetical protein